jgi:signal peptidase I
VKHARPARGRWWREAAVILVLAVGVALLLRTFVVQTYFIPSSSMVPTLQIGDRIIVNKLSFDLHSVHRGDIVVFKRPPHENCAGPPVADLVKRVIGLPGETIAVSGAGRVLINGRPIAQPWLPRAVRAETFPGPSGTTFNLSHPYKIPAGDYFMMGDNRTDSCDSRYWGPIPKSLIVGGVEARVWPLSAFHIF